MEIVRDDPLWRKIADEIRSDIADEVYPPGAPLPGEVALAERYKTSRPTVRRAIAELAGEGLLSAAHGRGTFVRPRPDRRTILIQDAEHVDLLDERNDPSRQGWLRGEHPEAARARERGVTHVTDTVLTRADRDQAEALGIRTGQMIVYRFQHWRHRKTQRIVSVTSAVPSHLLNLDVFDSYRDDSEPNDLEAYEINQVATDNADAPDVDATPDDEPEPENLPAPTPIYEHLAERGPVRFVATVTARMPHGDELADLGTEPGTPILVIQRTMTDSDGRPLEVTTIEAPADRFEAASATTWTDTASQPAILTL